MVVKQAMDRRPYYDDISHQRNRLERSNNGSSGFMTLNLQLMVGRSFQQPRTDQQSRSTTHHRSISKSSRAGALMGSQSGINQIVMS
ncbi:hypothetical protein BJX65DRAFT_248688 [Aspergillus insuetus]